MQRMRTLDETIKMIKKEDPDTNLSRYLIKNLADNVKIRSIKTGSKLLIDYDSLLAYLEGRIYELPIEQLTV